MPEAEHEFEPHEIEALEILLKVLDAVCVVALERIRQDAGIERDPRIAKRNSRNPA